MPRTERKGLVNLKRLQKNYPKLKEAGHREAFTQYLATLKEPPVAYAQLEKAYKIFLAK